MGAFNGNYKITGDYDYWLRCALETSFVVVPEILFYKRTHATNISANRIRMLLEHGDILESFFRTHRARIAENALLESYCLGAASIYYELGDLYFEEKKILKTFSFYRKAWAAWPSPSNFFKFILTVLKKLIRFLTFDLVKRRNLKKISGSVVP